MTSDDFSGTIPVAHNDKIIEKRAYGLSSIEYGAENKVDTKFNIASMTNKFSKALRNDILLNKETAALMFEPKLKGYNMHSGYGMDVDQRYNQIIQGHSGGWYGIRGELMDFMEDNYTIVILSNIDDGGKSGASKVANFFKDL